MVHDIIGFRRADVDYMVDYIIRWRRADGWLYD